jgi:WD40 repeat protein
MSKIKLFLMVCMVMLVTARCGTLKVSQILHPCTNLDQPNPFETIKGIKGSLLFEDILSYDTLSIVAINSTSSKELFTLDRRGSGAIIGLNPSGKWFGYLDHPPQSYSPLIHLISNQGERLMIPAEPLPGNERLWLPGNWVNDETILIRSNEMDTALLDAFTGSWLLELVDKLPNYYPFTEFSLSPDLSKALYVSQSEYNPLILWNFEQRKEIWSSVQSNEILFEVNQPNFGRETWSPNSATVAIVLTPEKDFTGLAIPGKLYLLDAKTGRLHQFRSMAENTHVNWLTWSPNGRYIAILTGLLKYPENPGIIIYDVEADVAIDMCPLKQWVTNYAASDPYSPLAWSPDSRYLVFGQERDAPEEGNQILMLDIFTGEVTLLKEGTAQYIGWSPYDWTTP